MEKKEVKEERTAADPGMKARMGRVKKDTGSFFDGARGGKYDLNPKNKDTGSFFDGARGGKYDLNPKNKDTGSFFDGARGGKYDTTTSTKTSPAAPTTPEKPLRSIDPSVERRLSVGAERVDKMAEKIRALRAMRARSQSRLMSQGEKPVTPMVVPSAKVEKPRSGRNAMRDSNDSMDAFDLVLEYLITTGQVDSLDEALYVMMEMDAETIQGIISEETEDSLRDRRQERGGSDGNQRYPSDRGVKKGPMSPEDKKKSREKSKSALDHVRSSITKQYGAGAIYKKKEKKDED